jgi:energy-coupling factor transporter ATP-binding protein EcfA2
VRNARVQDFRRRLRERAQDWPFRLDRFSFKGIPSLGEGDLSFPSPFTVISGPNGVGKTTLLRAIWASARPEIAIVAGNTAQKLPGGSAVLSFRRDGTSQNSEVVFASGEARGGVDLGVEVIHVDSASGVVEQQALLARFTDVDDLINGVGSKSLEGQDFETINYLARRDYRSIQMYEIEIDDGRVMPFFEIALGNDRYDSRTMGAGEIAVLFLWWSIERAADNSLILLEEPDTYLSPASQEAMYNYLLARTVTKHLTVVATSHSDKFIRLLSEDNGIFCFREPKGVRILDGAPPPAWLETIGVTPSVEMLVLVEDNAAEIFARQLLERIKPGLSRRIEISVRGGDGNIIRALEQIDAGFKSFSIIGLFDGDMLERIPDSVRRWSSVLPGGRPIEVVFREMIEADMSSFQNAIGIEGLDAILFGLRGSDHHDWYEGLCRQVGLPRHSCSRYW